MVDQKFENCCIFIKMSAFKFLEVLNQDGGSNRADQKFENSSI